MTDSARKAHWETVYQTKGERDVSWFQEAVDLARPHSRDRAGPDASIIDVGGGASRLPDALLDAGFRKIAVLDLSRRRSPCRARGWARAAKR